MKIDDYVTANRLMILLKGESGAGKSIQAGSFPNVYFFDFDNRIGSVANFYKKLGKRDIEFDYYPVDKWDAAENLIDGWQKNGCPFDTVVVDTTTTLIQATLYYINKMKGNVASSKGKDSFGMAVDLGKIKGTALDDYKFLLSGMKQIIYGLKELTDAHVIFNAHIMMHEKTDMQGNTSVMRHILAPGKTAQEIPIHFDEIYHIDIENNPIVGMPSKRIILTDSTSMDFARTSLPLPKTFDVTEKFLYQHLQEAVPTIGQNLKTSKPKTIQF